VLFTRPKSVVEVPSMGTFAGEKHSHTRTPSLNSRTHSSYQVIEPWGEVIATTEHDAATVTATLEFDKLTSFRTGVPISLQKRHDIYYPVKLCTGTQRTMIALGSALAGAVVVGAAFKLGFLKA
jgi:hypothetical protein